MLDKIALQQYLKHPAKQEWGVFIGFIFIVKIITWGISVYAGFYYLKNFIQTTMVESEIGAKLFAVIFLVAWEVLTTISLAKFFKFFFRGLKELKAAIGVFVVVLIFFGISFYTSTNGLSMRQSDKVDNTNDILLKEEIQINNTQKEYQGLIADINNQINTIKANPEGWSGGRRIVLLAHQNRQIDSLFQRKAAIQKEFKNDLTQIKEQTKSNLELNKTEQTSEADKYYKIIAWVMIIQFLSSGLLMFFWRKITLEKNPDAIIDETVDSTVEITDNLVIGTFNNRSAQLNNKLVAAFNYRWMMPETNLINPEKEEKEKSLPKPKEIVGFKIGQNQEKTSYETDKLLGYPKQTQVISEKDLGYLRKHVHIVEIMKELGIPTKHKNSISNQEAITVSKIAENRGVVEKSESLVKKIFPVFNSIGAERILIKNGEIEII